MKNTFTRGLEKKRDELIMKDSKLAQLGINMVDLMMWLVIAALLLAAALQGIGFYQQAAWTYQARSDVASTRTYMEAQYTLNQNVYPTIVDGDNAAFVTNKVDLKLTGNNKAAATDDGKGGWKAAVVSEGLSKAGKPAFFEFSSTSNDNNPKAVVAITSGVTLTAPGAVVIP